MGGVVFEDNGVNWAAVSEQVGRAPKVSFIGKTSAESHRLTVSMSYISLAATGTPLRLAVGE